MDGLENLSEVERLKILKVIRVGCKTEKDFSYYVNKFANGIEPVEIKRRLAGYFLEDEFSLFCFLNQCCTSVTPLGQSPVGNDQLKIPDYLVTFKTKLGNYPCFVEVKTTAKYATGRITNNMLDGYKRYAANFRLPLFFASRIQIGTTGLWILQSSKEFEANGRSASIELYTKTSGFSLLDDWGVTIINPFELELQYSATPSGSSIFHEGLGFLTGVVAHTRAVSKLYGVASPDILGTISFTNMPFLNILFDRFFTEENITRCEHGVTVNRKINAVRTEFISSLLISINKFISDEDGVVEGENASRLIAKIENGYSGYIDRQKLLQMIEVINAVAMEVISQPLIGFGDLGEVGARDKYLENFFKDLRK